MAPIALLSVSNKEGLVPFAKVLTEEHQFKIISSGGTAKLLAQEGIPVQPVADYTGAPEILGGRVKTLHPRIHGGILAKTDESSHQKDLADHKISKIDLVVVNLYPFIQTVSDPNVSWENAIENIDIGGPTMIRSAAKNHKYVSIITSPNMYDEFLNKLKSREVDEKYRKQLALDAFAHTAQYDIAISKWINQKINAKESTFLESVPLKQSLRYGENPHQSASWFSKKNEGWGSAIQLQGKELSTNNLLDLEAALLTVREFGYGDKGNAPCQQKAAAVVKHTNPCGLATGESSCSAVQKAINADRTSAFGGIVAFNCKVEKDAANELLTLFLECVVAPEFSTEAKVILSSKKNLRLLELNPSAIDNACKKNLRSILGGMVIQDLDEDQVSAEGWKVVTNESPNDHEREDMVFAWKLVRHVRSNAIVVACNGQSLGIGAGQMNRIGSAKLALEAAGEKAEGAILASDGFFPFDDTVQLAKEYGIKCIIQPGGSIRDQDSIEACNNAGISMIFTNKRHFLH